MNDRIADTRQCPYCRIWIAMPLRRQREAFEAHKLRCRAEDAEAVIVPNSSPAFSPDCGRCGADIAADPFHHCPDERTLEEFREAAASDESASYYQPRTVKRADLWGNVTDTDTHRTESELNGFRATQGALL